MPTGIYIRKKEEIERARIMGKKNNGKHLSEKTKTKMRISAKKSINSGKFKKGQIAPMKGRKRPDMTGEKNNHWKGGVSKQKGYSNIFKIRYKARKYQAEGSHTFGEWELLKKQYGYECPSCRRNEPEVKLTEDHIIPLSKGGSDYIENIQPLCKSCNCKKYNNKVIKYKLCN